VKIEKSEWLRVSVSPGISSPHPVLADFLAKLSQAGELFLHLLTFDVD